MPHRTGGIVLELYPDPVRLLDHVAVGHDVSLGIDDYARAKRALAQRPLLSTLSTEEAVKKVVKWTSAPAAFVVIAARGAPAMRVLYGRFGIDVDHARFELLGDLGKLARKRLGRRNAQRGGVCGRRFLALLSFYALRDDGPNQDTDGQSGQNREGIREAICLPAHPDSASALLHRHTSSAVRTPPIIPVHPQPVAARSSPSLLVRRKAGKKCCCGYRESNDGFSRRGSRKASAISRWKGSSRGRLPQREVFPGALGGSSQ